MVYHTSIINENENEIFVNEAKNAFVNENETKLKSIVVNENENETKYKLTNVPTAEQENKLTLLIPL